MKLSWFLMPAMALLTGWVMMSIRYGRGGGGAVYDYGPYHRVIGLCVFTLGAYMLIMVLHAIWRARRDAARDQESALSDSTEGDDQ